MSMLDEKGYEIPDQTPVAVPVRMQRYERDHIREIIRQEMSRQAEDQGFETWEESDDFDVGDDFDPISPYEEQFDPDTGESSWNRNVEPPAGDVEPGAAANPEAGTSGDETPGSAAPGNGSIEPPSPG